MFGKAEFVGTNKALTAFSAVAAIALALGGCGLFRPWLGI